MPSGIRLPGVPPPTLSTKTFKTKKMNSVLRFKNSNANFVEKRSNNHFGRRLSGPSPLFRLQHLQKNWEWSLFEWVRSGTPPPTHHYTRGCERSRVFGPFIVLLNVGPDEVFIRGPPPPLKTLHEGMDRPYGKVVKDFRAIYCPRKRRPRWNVNQGFPPPSRTLHEKMWKVKGFRPIYCPLKRRPRWFAYKGSPPPLKTLHKGKDRP